MDLSSFLTDSTIKKINSWEEQFNVKVIITKPSQSRLGVFIPKRFENHVIRINNNMNEYAFLITLIHEMKSKLRCPLTFNSLLFEFIPISASIEFDDDFSK